MAIPEPPRRIASVMDFGRNEYFEFPGDRRQAECTPVKRFVMDTAQRQPVRNLTRATSRVPFDMGGL